MPVSKIDPKVIFASNAPAIDKPPVFSDKTKGWDVSRANDGRPTIKEMNKVQQDTDLKILWLNENSVTPYDASIDYPDGAVAIKDGSFKQLVSGSWVEFLDGFANKDEVKRGIANRYDSSLTYNSGDRVVLTNGDIVKSTVPNNINNPNIDMTGWVYKSQTLVTNDYTTLAALSEKDGVIAFVKAEGICGEFVYKSASTATPNGGTIIASTHGGNWLRLYEDVLNVKWFGATGNGVTDDTIPINNCLSAAAGKNVYFPAGRYLYAGNGHSLGNGTIAFGAGRKQTTILSATASPSHLFWCEGYGSGVEHMGFDAAVPQTSGCYVYLGGPETYINDFFMNGDFCGVNMTGNVSQIRHGRFQDAANGAVRIAVGGGDNSQTISNVLMGAQTPANIALAGIRIQDSVALTIHNVSIIQQNNGILIDPVAGKPVLNLFVSQCFFDNCNLPINISPDGGAVRRLYLTDVWASSGINGVTINPINGGTVKGVHFTNLQANLNSGSGISTGANGVISEIYIHSGNISGNAYGVYVGGGLDRLKIGDVNIGNFDDFSGNGIGVSFNGTGYSNIRMLDTDLSGNTTAIQGLDQVGSANIKIRDVIGV